MKKRLWILLTLLACGTTGVYGQLSGSYTINPNGSGTRNYTSISAAISALTSNGVSGNVTFNIADGRYTQNIQITSSITGLSNTNTITFDGQNANKTEIRASYPVYILRQKHIRVHNLTLSPTSIYGVYLYQADSNKVENCIVNGNRTTSSSSYRNVYLYQCNNDTIRNCEVYGAYYGVYINGSSTTSYNSNQNAVIDCKIKHNYDYAVYNRYSSESLIEGNEIDSLRDGFFTYHLYSYYSNQTKILRNKVFYRSTAYYGMYLNNENYYPSSSSSGYRSTVANNFVGGDPSNVQYAIYSGFRSQGIDFLHNTVIASNSSSSTRALYITSGSDHKVKNNNLNSLNGGYALYISSVAYVDSLDYNNLYTSGGNYAYLSGTRSTLGDLQSYGSTRGMSQNSDSIEIAFTDAFDVYRAAVGLNNNAQGGQGIDVDIDGNPRPTSPDTKNDIGCYDFYLPQYDAGIAGFPIMAACPGNTTAQTVVQNYGTDTLTSIKLNWSIKVNSGNYSSQSSSTYSSTLAPGQSATVSLGTFSLSSGNVYTIKAWTSSPNNQNDGKASNDTSYTTVRPALSGTYSIGGTGADYSKIADAIAAIKQSGICGAVTFRLGAQQFSEQLIIPEIPGASGQNTIRIVGQGADKTSITFDGSGTADQATIMLDGADHVHFDSLSILGTDQSYASALWLTNSADSNAVTNCVLKVPIGNGYYTNVVVFSGSATSHTTYGSAGNYNVLDHCTIRGGYRGVNIYGGTSSFSISTYIMGNTIQHCSIDSQYYYGIYALRCGESRILNNNINTASYQYGAAVYHSYSVRDTIIGNTINTDGGRYSLYFGYSNYYGGSSDSSYLFNNMISGGSDYSLYSSRSYRTHYYYNSLSGDNSRTAYMLLPYYSRIINNTFENRGTGMSFYINSTLGMSTGDWDFNNYYAPNASTLAYYSGNRADLAALQTASTSFNGGSISADPQHVAADDLTSLSVNLNNKATSLWHVDYDIHGETRPKAPDQIPDIGADEYYLPPYDLDIAGLTPERVGSGTATDITMVLSNKGINPIVDDTAYVSWKLNTGSWVNDSVFIDSLPIGQDTVFTFKQQLTVSSGSNYDLCARISGGINGDPDNKDELCLTGCLGSAGTYTIDASGNGDFTSFAKALASLNGCGLAGPVVFNVKAGTYTESLEVTEVNGASSQNTVTFKGSGKYEVVLTNTASSLNGYQTVMFNGADYFRFENMTIEAGGQSYANCLWFTDEANYNVVENCILKSNANSSSTYTNPVVLSGSTLYPTSSGNSGNYNSIVNNRIVGGGYGVYVRGMGYNSYIQGNNVKNNVFRSQGAYGIYSFYSGDMEISGNDIDSFSSTSGTGIYAYYGNKLRLNANKVIAHTNGLYLNFLDYYVSGDTSTVTNNMVSGFTSFNSRPVYLYYARDVRFVHNSIHTSHSSTSTSYPALYLRYCDRAQVINNNVARYSNGYVLYHDHYTASLYATFENNNFYSTQTSGNVLYFDAYYSSVSAMETGRSSYAQNNLSVDPGFLGTNDLHTDVLSLNNAGQNMAYVTHDIDGDERPISPDVTVDIGADEYYVPPYDADITAVGPSRLLGGNNTITMELTNRGSQNWNNDTLYVEYQIDNGTAVQDTVLTGNVSYKGTQSFSFTQPYNQSGGGMYKNLCIKINPAWKTDPDTTSDVLCQDVCTPASGQYVVDPSGNGDFTTVSQSVDYLNCAQIAGAVEVKILPGQYDEQILLSQLYGSSSTHTVRFVGAGSSTVIGGSYTGTDNYVWRFNGADHVTLDSLSFTNAGAGGTVLHFMNKADSNTVSNCALSAEPNTSSNSAVVYISGASNSTSTGDNGNYNRFENNRISGGYYGMAIVGSSSSNLSLGNEVVNCKFSNNANVGIFGYFHKNSLVDQNEINGLRNTSGYGIYSSYGSNNVLSNNLLQSGRYGIYLYAECFSHSTDTTSVVNNMCSNFDDQNYQVGIYTSFGRNNRILHNSIWTEGTTASTSYPSLYVNSTAGCEVKNNVIANTGNSYTVYKSGSYDNDDWDYNAYHAPNYANPYYDGGTISNLSSWKTNTSNQNSHSVEVDPGFISMENLHSFSDSINNVGDNQSSWPVDFDQEARPTSPDTTVDIGADDYWIPLRDLDPKAIVSPAIVQTGQNNVTVLYQNRGLRNLNNDTAIVSYRIDAGSWQTDSLFIKALAVGEDTAYTFTSRWNVSSASNFQICARVDTLLSSAADSSDEICVQRCTGVKDTLVVDAKGGGDYTTISAAVDRLSCGIYGDVVIYVKNGQYTDVVSVDDNIPGLENGHTITIMGEDREKVIWDAISSAPATLILSAIEDFTLKNLSIKNSAAGSNNSGMVICLTDDARRNTIENCHVSLPSGATSTRAVCIATSSRTDLPNYTGQNADSTTIRNCTIEGGGIGVSMVGFSTSGNDVGNTIENCIIKSQESYGIYYYAQELGHISENQITGPNNNNSYAIMQYYGKDMMIDRNQVESDNGYGLYLYYHNFYGRTSSTQTNIINNVFNQTGSSARDNVYAIQCYNINHYHNTYITNTSYNSGLELYICYNQEVKNNIFNAKNNGYCLYVYSGSTSSNAIDYNNYFGSASGNERFYYSFSVINGLSNFQSGQNANSIAVDPVFTGSSDFHAGAYQLIGAGDDLNIDLDFEGDKRDGIAPDIGADEIHKDVVVSHLLSPVNACRKAGDDNQVSVTITNQGPSTLVAGDSLFMQYAVGSQSGLDTLVLPANTNLATGQSGNYSFSSAINTGAAGQHNISLWGDYQADTMLDDTLKASYFTNPVPVAGMQVSEECDYDATAFTDKSTLALGSIDTWAWQFGDGKGSANQNPEYQYGMADTFDVSLVVTSDSGCVDTAAGTAITNPAPSANFSTSSVCHHEEASFSNSSTLAYGSLSYNWDFDDNTNTSTTTNPTLSYASDGQYEVELAATSGEGCSDTVTKSIDIYPTPNPAFTASEECENNSTSFTNNTSITSGGINSAWRFGDGNSSTSNAPTHTYGAAGSYTATLLSTSTAHGCKDSVSETVVVNPLPTSSFAVSNMCFGDTLRPIDRSTGNITGWKWYFGDGNSSTMASPEHRYASSGTYTVSLVVTTNKGCTDSSSNSLSVATRPQSAFIASTECVHDSVSFTNQTSVACGVVNNYLWEFGDGNSYSTSSSSNIQHRYASSGNYTARLIITLANGFKDTSSQKVVVHNPPTASFTNNATCEGNLVQFTSTSKSGSASLSGYAWTMGDGGTSTLRNPTNTYANSGSYTVMLIASDRNSCSDSTTAKITVSPMPVAKFTAKNACEGDTVNFSNNSTLSSGSLSYVWNFGDNTSSTATAPSKVYGSASYYTVKLVATSNANCKDSTTGTVQAYALPVASFSASAVCDGEKMNFSNQSSGAASYAWNFGDNSGTSSATAPTYQYAQSGDYAVDLKATSSNGCVDMSTDTVTVHALPSASFMTNDECDGEQVSFRNNSSGANSYSWSYGDGSGSTLSAPKHTYKSAGTYHVELTATSSAGCEDDASDSVEIFALPTAGFSAADVCDGNAMRFSNSSSGANSYAWDFGDNSGTSSSTAPSYTYNSTGTYTIQLTASTSNGCTDTESRDYTVNPNPSISFNASNECEGDAINFSNNSTISSGTMSHSWDFGDNKGTSKNVSPSYTYAADGNYTVRLTSTSNEGCQSSGTGSVVVNPAPTANFSASNVCLSDAMAFSNSSSGASSYNWSFGDGNTSTNSAPNHTYANAGNYTVTLEAASDSGCTDIITKSVTVYTNPQVKFTVSNVCDGVAMTTTNSTTNANSYAWDFGNGSSSSQVTPSHTYASSGNYTVKLVATSSNGCLDSANTTVSIYALPSVSFTSSTECEGTRTAFTNSSSGAASYTWQFGDGGSSTLASPRHLYRNADTFNVQLTGLSSNNCSATATRNVVVNPSPSASISANNICAEDTMMFANNSRGASTYKWYFDDGDSSSITSPGHYYSTEGQYNVRLIATSAEGCIDEATLLREVYDKPEAAITYNYQNPDELDCENEVLVYSVDSVQTAVTTYGWDFSDGKGTRYGRSLNQSWNAPGSYPISLTLTTTEGCTDRAAISMDIYANPEASFSAHDTCLAEAIQFTNTSKSGDQVNYTWRFGDGNTTTTESPTHAYKDTDGNYTVTLKATTTNGCWDEVFQKVRIFPLPNAEFTANEVCLGDTTSFTNYSVISSGALSYTWDFGNGSSENATNPKVRYEASGNYDVTLNVVSDRGCVDAQTKTVASFEVPNAQFALPSRICAIDPVSFPDSMKNQLNPEWQIRFYDDQSLSYDSLTSYFYTTPGFYRPSLAITTENGCYDSVAMGVEVLVLPNAAWSYKRIDDGQITFSPVNVDGALYEWDFGNGDTAVGMNPTYAFTTAGVTEVILTVTNENGCSRSLKRAVEVFPTGVESVGNGHSISAYPNPFANETKVVFHLREQAFVRIEVYDMQGRSLGVLQNGQRANGRHEMLVPAEMLSQCSGNVMMRVIVDDEVHTMQLVRLK